MAKKRILLTRFRITTTKTVALNRMISEQTARSSKQNKTSDLVTPPGRTHFLALALSTPGCTNLANFMFGWLLELELHRPDAQLLFVIFKVKIFSSKTFDVLIFEKIVSSCYRRKGFQKIV